MKNITQLLFCCLLLFAFVTIKAQTDLVFPEGTVDHQCIDKPLKTINLGGKITDISLGETLPHAVIVLRSGNQIMDYTAAALNGNYSFTDIPDGVYSIECFAAGYNAAKFKEVRVSKNTPQQIDFLLIENELMPTVMPTITEMCRIGTGRIVTMCNVCICCFASYNDSINESPVGPRGDDGRTVGIDETDPASFLFYPNPTNGLLNIESPVPVESVIITDLSGKQVLDYHENGLTKTVVNLSSLPAGIYLVHLLEGKNRLSRKIILSK